MSWIQTYTGRQFFPLDPDPESIDIRDIAHSLSLQCRFNGHCLEFYSVAQHSVSVSRILPAHLARWGLLHDAAEAYLSDLPRPVKQVMPQYREQEESLLETIAARFGLEWPLPQEVLVADTRLLATEARDLMAEPPMGWGLGVEPLDERVEPWPAGRAEEEFLGLYSELTEAGGS